MPQAAATMAVLIQELHCPKVSFVLHTARPSDGNTGIVLVEAAPGQVRGCGKVWRWGCGWGGVDGNTVIVLVEAAPGQMGRCPPV